MWRQTAGITALMAAAQQGRTETVKLLLRCPKIDIAKKTTREYDWEIETTLTGMVKKPEVV